MRKPLAILLLLALAATPALGESRYVGTWVYKSGVFDAVKVLKLKVRDKNNAGWGVAVGYGYTPTLEVRLAETHTLFATLSGIWSDATEKDALFALGEATCLAPASGYQDYECYLVLSKAGFVAYMSSDDDAGVFLFRAQTWP